MVKIAILFLGSLLCLGSLAFLYVPRELSFEKAIIPAVMACAMLGCVYIAGILTQIFWTDKNDKDHKKAVERKEPLRRSIWGNGKR